MTTLCNKTVLEVAENNFWNGQKWWRITVQFFSRRPFILPSGTTIAGRSHFQSSSFLSFNKVEGNARKVTWILQWNSKGQKLNAIKENFQSRYCWLGNQIFARTHNQKKCTPNFFCCRWISGNLCEFSLISPFNYSNNFRKRRNFFSYSLSQNFTLEKAVANTSEEGFTRNSSKGEISFKLERISKTWFWKEKEEISLLPFRSTALHLKTTLSMVISLQNPNFRQMFFFFNAAKSFLSKEYTRLVKEDHTIP